MLNVAKCAVSGVLLWYLISQHAPSAEHFARVNLAWVAAGLIALPLAFVIFKRLPDRGYAFAKPVGILLAGYLFWLALTAHLLPNRAGSILWCFVALAAVSGVVFWARREEILAAYRERATVIIAVEVVFTVGLFIAAYLRSFIPEIDGTEIGLFFRQ